MRKKLSVIVSLLVLLSMLVGACAAPPAAPAQGGAGAAGAATAEATGEATGEATAAVQAPPGATRIAFWHSMGGDVGGISIPKLADDFNASQAKCFVEPTYQGSYDDSLNKLRAGLQSNDIPALVQLFDIATKLMVDLKVAKPVQDFMDAENFDTSDFEPNVLAYYTIDGKQYSMPFNTSTPLLYYNKDMFKAAGLDPEKPPRTFDEVAQYAEKLTQRDDSGKVTVSGGAFAIYGWFVEQFLAVSGALYANNGNGRDDNATEAVFNGPEGVRILEWWKGMVRLRQLRQLWPHDGRYPQCLPRRPDRHVHRLHRRAARHDRRLRLASLSWAPAGCRARTRLPLTTPARSSAALRCGSLTAARRKSRSAPGSSSSS